MMLGSKKELLLVDYLNAAERALKLNQNMKVPDVMRQMMTNLPSNPNIIKLFSPRAKRLLSRRPVSSVGLRIVQTKNSHSNHFYLVGL